jgi:hypothetical protein
MTGLERVFRRIPGEGWLLLAGAIPELGGETADLMERLLEKLDLSRPIAAMAAPDSDSTEVNELLETLEEWLGAEAGYLELDTDLGIDGWEDSGLLILIGDDPEIWIEALRGEADERLRRALFQGTLILAVGGAARAFGTQVVSTIRGEAIVPALNWIPGTMLVADSAEAGSKTVRSWLQSDEERLVMVLEPSSILALGPEHEVERWGRVPPEIVLGSGWGKG